MQYKIKKNKYYSDIVIGMGACTDSKVHYFPQKKIAYFINNFICR